MPVSDKEVTSFGPYVSEWLMVFARLEKLGAFARLEKLGAHF